MLRDDPRLLRALRFAATLGFRLDASFWRAAPFALQPGGGLDTKVSPSRKLSELRKIAARAGAPQLVDALATEFEGGVSLSDALLFPARRADAAPTKASDARSARSARRAAGRRRARAGLVARGRACRRT